MQVRAYLIWRAIPINKDRSLKGLTPIRRQISRAASRLSSRAFFSLIARFCRLEQRFKPYNSNKIYFAPYFSQIKNEKLNLVINIKSPHVEDLFCLIFVSSVIFSEQLTFQSHSDCLSL